MAFRRARQIGLSWKMMPGDAGPITSVRPCMLKQLELLQISCMSAEDIPIVI